MSLIDAVQKGVKACFAALQELQSQVRFKQYYRDANNDRVLRESDINGLLTDYSEFERQNQNMPFSTKKLICESSWLVGLTPNIADKFEIDEQDWRIESIEFDPTGSVYTFQITK